ncbi:MAG: lytic murein transglycosylase B [Gammaproteobacteria bacterium]
MNIYYITKILLLIFFMTSHSHAKDIDSVNKFISYMQDTHGFDKQILIPLFDNAIISNTILEAISRPAEKKLSWHQYRKIFIQKKRIEQGAQFWENNESKLKEAEKKFGVPPEIIVAIIGVETFYGKISGDYRVIDALNTLAFHYPKRAAFFRSELEQFLLLAREQNFNPKDLKGSYAGAMGMPQFISSSYRNYAIDFDNDDVIDIWNNRNDVIGSIANYFSKHGWKSGEPVISKVSIEGENYKKILDNKLHLNITGSDLDKYGIKTNLSFNENEKLRLFQFNFEKFSEFWLARNNFYVITRYNHSKLYAMAVYELALKVKKYKDDNFTY